MPHIYVMSYELTPFEKEMENILLEMQEQLQGKIAGTDQDFRNVVGASGIKDSIDLATDDMAAKKMEAISKVDSNRLKAVEQALVRIRNGKYGICAQCGKRIPEGRLRALPYALLCMDCKNKNEQH